MIIIGLLLFAVSFGAGYYRGLTAGTARWRREIVDAAKLAVLGKPPETGRPPHG